jgi:hypothetical protein
VLAEAACEPKPSTWLDVDRASEGHFPQHQVGTLSCRCRCRRSTRACPLDLLSFGPSFPLRVAPPYRHRAPAHGLGWAVPVHTPRVRAKGAAFLGRRTRLVPSHRRTCGVSPVLGAVERIAAAGPASDPTLTRTRALPNPCRTAHPRAHAHAHLPARNHPPRRWLCLPPPRVQIRPKAALFRV